MKKSTILISTALFMFSLFSCSPEPPGKIPSGKWNYSLKINGVTAGKAVISYMVKDGLHISTNEMYLNAGYIRNSSVQTTIEKSDFTPVKLEIHNTVEDSRTGKKQTIDKVAEFNGNVVNLKSGDYQSQIKLKQPFFLDGSYFLNELIDRKFKTGTRITAKIYEPTVEIDETILVVVEVIGREKLYVNGNESELIHIKQKVEKLKSIDMYLNNRGITEKVTIKMLNNIFELSRE